MKHTLSELETLSGLKFSTDSEIIYNNNDEGRGSDDYSETIVFSPAQQAKFSDETYPGGGEEALNLLKDSMKAYDFGTLKSKASVESVWENKNGKWQAKSVETAKGFYLRLENFK